MTDEPTDFNTENMLLRATETYWLCGKDFAPGTIAAHICACPKCIATNPAVLSGIFGVLPESKDEP